MSDAKQAAILAVEAKITKANDREEVVAEAAPEVVEIQAETPAAVVEHDDDEDTEDSASSDGDDTTAPHRKPRRGSKRIDQLTREKHEERRAREAAEQRADWFEQKYQSTQQRQPEPTQQAHGKPTLEAYGYDQEAYETARDTWVIDQAKQSWTQERQQEADSQRQQQRQTTLRGRIAAFEKEQPGGWEAAINAPYHTTPVILEAIQESEIGPKVAYYLSQHIDEAQAIAELAPFGQAIAMGRLEARLQATPAPQPRPQTTVSRAPAPATMVTSGSPSGISPENMGIEDHIAAVRAKKKAQFS